MMQDLSAFETVACLCHAHADRDQIILAKDEIGTETFTYVTCQACSLQRLSPRPGPGHIGAYYPANYVPHSGVPRIGFGDRLKRLAYLTFWAPDAELPQGLRAARPLLRILLLPIKYRTVLAFDPPGRRRVFEFGAAKATDLLAFRAAGWEVAGCEPSAQACRIAAAAGIELQNATAETAILDDDAFSCVLFNNVFEHIHDPTAVLAKCRRALQDRGVLTVVVPNHASLTARLFGAAWPGYDAPRHIWGWTPAALRRHFSASGFEIEYVHHQATGAWLWRSTLDMRHTPLTPGPVRRWLAGHASPLFVPFSLAAAALGYGDFIRVVARKV